ncbi:MAG TPA: 4-hydroxyphenylpyruvate dioxygenase [Kofleriaceae bacterium]|nr:4-hydroxyphenylpyruvate dioxygenase [Kofleriaceae bacterium]
MNPVGVQGIAFVELAGPRPDQLHDLLIAFGFSRTMRHATRAIDLYEQREMTFLLDREPTRRGPTINAMGWYAASPQIAIDRGAKPAQGLLDLPAIHGIGESLIYFVRPGRDGDRRALGFVPHERPVRVPDKGFVAIDHLTNNVYAGTMERWASFYKDVFGFTEVRYFDIRGVMTGLTSYALRSPCGTFAIPINEAAESKSQINEYLDEHGGPGIQHLAFTTDDILASLRALDGTPIRFLDIDDDYYATVFDRVPRVTEDREALRARNVLIDGDDRGYLLQIFTHNLIGPIFIEIIQRRGHDSFGEGNFGALFRSIERDQVKRGYLTQDSTRT